MADPSKPGGSKTGLRGIASSISESTSSALQEISTTVTSLRSCRPHLEKKKTKLKKRLQKSPTRKIFALHRHFIIAPIATGKLGSVVKSRYFGSGQQFVLKARPKALVSRKPYWVERVREERLLLAAAKFKYINSIHSVFQDNANIFAAYEYAERGSLKQFIEDRAPDEPVGADLVRFCLAQIVLAVEYLHSADIVHRMIEPAHVLIFKNGYLKLCDFYLAKRLVETASDGRKVTGSIVGHVDYLAPERFRPEYGMSVDWWSVGVLGFELLTLQNPFIVNYTDAIDLVRKRIEEVEPMYPAQEGDNALCVKLLRALLVKNYVNRLGTANDEDVRGHEYFRDVGWYRLYKQKHISPLLRYKHVAPLRREFVTFESSDRNLLANEFKYFTD